MRTKLAVIAALLLVLGAYEGVSHALAKPTATVVGFVGDSNVLLATGYVSKQFFARNDSYPFVVVDRVGAGIRTSDCTGGSEPCATHDYWRMRLAAVRSKLQPDVYVVDLGVNDTLAPGTAAGPGYADYGKKIDYFLGLLGNHPVLWTNLPCAIEPKVRLVGCNTVNAALTAAAARHPNLTVLDWAAVADPHPAWMATFAGGVHYAPFGYASWSQLVTTALEARFGSS